MRPRLARPLNIPPVEPLRIDYYPHPGQLAFQLDRDVVTERFLCAGTRAGKTYGAADECLDITFREAPDHAAIAAPDYPQLGMSVIPTLEQLLGRPLHALMPYGKFNEQKKTLRWWNGWVWHFASMDDPTSVEGLPSCSLVWLNEARLVTDFGGDDGAWSNLTRRLGGRGARRRYAILDTHSATRQIMDELDAVSVETYRAEGGTFSVHQGRDPQRRLYQWGTEDAIKWKTLDEESGRRIIARYKSPSAKKRILQGLHAVPAGVCLDAFEPGRHLKAPPADYVFEWFSGGIDWGWTEEHPCGLILWGHSGSRSWILGEAGGHDVKNKGLHAGVHWSLARIKQEAEALMEAWDVEDCTWVGGHDKPEQADALDDMGLDCTTYSGRVEDGIDLMNRRLGADDIMVHPDCLGWRHDQENYVRGKDGKPDKDAYDPHLMDASRYGLLGGKRPRYAENIETDED